MPARGTRPGYKGGRYRPELGRRLPYWIATNVVRDPMGFPDACIPLPADADAAEIDRLCRQHTARLLAYIDAQRAGHPSAPRYDGSMGSACELFQTHPLSRFHRVKANTRKSYLDSLKVIVATVGKRQLRNVTILDCEHWYEQWRRPARDGGEQRIKRAHGAISTVRMVVRFLAKLRIKEAKQLADELRYAQFERGGARTQEMTYAQASLFVRSALALEREGKLPARRGLYMAIGVAAQFDLGLRQGDVIGQWQEGGTWAGLFRWENIPGWRWRMKTSKSKYRAAAIFDLTQFGLLFPLLEVVPHAERAGAIVKGEGGLPFRYRTYQKDFRRIARAADIPDEVWSMDLRAGAAREAEEAGVELGKIARALTHSKTETTLRYIRRQEAVIADVAKARGAKRAADEGGNA